MEPRRARFETDSYLLDDDTVESVLAGKTRVETVPAPYQAVAQLLQNARSLPLTLGNENAAVSAILAGAREANSYSISSGGWMRGHALGFKVAGVAAGIVFVLSGTAAAAATGNLPAPAQNVVASTVAHAGIDLPNEEHTPKADDKSSRVAGDRTSPSGKSASTTTTVPKDDVQPPASTTLLPTVDDEGGKPAEPTATGQEHQSASGAEHSKGADNSEKPK